MSIEATLPEHIVLISAVGAYLFLALVSGLPEPGDPRPVSQKIYQTIYVALHILANRVVLKYPPPPPTDPKGV